MMNIKEAQFESDIESYLLSAGGYTKGDTSTYDAEKAIDLSKLVRYIEATRLKGKGSI